jgi:RHS repeat-associated protein
VSQSSNRLTSVQDYSGTTSVSYDAAGNVIADGLGSYIYSARGRMSAATLPGGTVNYLYNALEQRVSKTGPAALVPTGASYYAYDEAGRLLGEYDAAGVPRYETVYLGDTPVAVVTQARSTAGGNLTVQSNMAYVYSDHLDTPRVLARAGDHAILWRWDLAEAFGATPAVDDPNGLGVFTFNQRFPGQVFDAETGLHYNGHRDYSPRVGRYQQSDPIGLDGGVNTFAYVQGNPVQYVDPLGQARHGGKTGQWWEFTDRNFQRWFHQCVKGPGDPDATREELADAYAQWVDYGRPDGKNGCGGPPPAPAGSPAGSPAGAAGAACEDCKKVASLVMVGGTAYVIYRCIRMIPSLFPPLWPTIPLNAVAP